MDRKDLTAQTISLTYLSPSGIEGMVTPHPTYSTGTVLVSLSQYYDLHVDIREKKRIFERPGIRFLDSNCGFMLEQVIRYNIWQCHTDKKENQIFLLYKEIQKELVEKSYKTNGLVTYG